MIEINQQLTEVDWRVAAAVHYSTHRVAKIRPWLGGFLIALGAYLFSGRIGSGVQMTTIPMATLFVFYGGFMVVGKYLHVRRILKNIRATNPPDEETLIEIDKDGTMKMSMGEENSTTKIGSLFGFATYDAGILLYAQPNLFSPLKRDSFGSAEQIDELVALLEEHGVKRVKVW